MDRTESASKNMSSTESIVFDSKMMKTSTQEFAATWGGRSSLPDSGRQRRAHSWSGIQPEDSPSEVRILRERLVRTQTKLRPSAIRHLSRHQRLTLASLALVDFMSFCSMSIMAPFFPREASEKGLSETMCGLVFSFYAVVMFLTSPLFGKYLPTIGAKFMFISGMFLAGSCNILFGTLIRIRNYSSFTVLCFIVRGMEAVGASAYSTASYVFVVNAFPDSIGSVLGILETFVGLGMSVGPAIGGLLYSIGGFGLPFYSLGAIMILTVPLNFIWLADCDEYVTGSKSASIFRLFKIPSIIITGLVIVIVSNTWAFLDPTLEPHLRQFGLSTKQIGLIFMLFSSLYGIFSPIWGWVADRVHNHWCMMVWGLFLSTIGLLLLGPCPFIPYLPEGLWLDLVALSILGISVALTLLPTFQGVLTSSIYEGGCPEALATYSAVAGVWSCCYSLGEVTGPALGGALAETYGFPLSATMCASACFCMVSNCFPSYEGGCPEALATYSAVAGVWSCCYSLGEVTGPALGGALAETYGFPLSATMCASACFCMVSNCFPSYEGGCPEALATYSAVAGVWSCCYSLGEVTGPALGGALAETYGFPLSATMCASACFCMAVVTLTFFSLSESSKWVNSHDSTSSTIPYSDTTWNSNDFCRTRSAPCQRTESSPLLAPCSCQAKQGPHAPEGPSRRICVVHNKNKSGSASVASAIAYFLKFQYLTDLCIKIRLLTSKPDEYDREELYQNYLENDKKNSGEGNLQKNIRNGTNKNQANEKGNRNGFCLYLDREDDGGSDVVVKRNNTGIVTKLDGGDRQLPDEIIRHNLQKVQFYEQSPTCFSNENIFDGCECRDGVTYVRGTVTVSSAGACEV